MTQPLWPSLTWAFLSLLGLGMSIKGGEDVGHKLIAAVMTWTLLYFGGFFNPILGQ